MTSSTLITSWLLSFTATAGRRYAGAYSPDDTYSLISQCTSSYNASSTAPALKCPQTAESTEMLIPKEWLLDGGDVSSTWKEDAFGLRDHVSVYFDLWWKGCNPGYGVWTMASCIGEDVAAVARAGYKITISPGMHHAPQYCFTRYDAYWRNAKGRTLHPSEFDMGCNLVFYPEARAMVRNYYAKIRERLQEINATLSVMRIGFAQTGEFNYPLSNVGDGYWAFGPNGSALPGYPLGSFRPGHRSDYATAKKFIAWYLEALAVAQNELASYVLELFPSASPAMLYPNLESLYPDVAAETSKLADGDTTESGVSRGWVRSLLIPRLADVKIAGKMLAWSTSAMTGEQRFHTLDMMQRFSVFSNARAAAGSPSINLAAEDEGGTIHNLTQLMTYLGYAHPNRPSLLFFCCMTLPYAGMYDNLYKLVTAAADAFMQRSVLCYPDTLHGLDDRIYSADLSHMLRLQGDGNLVSYSTDPNHYGASPSEFWEGKVLWSTHTAGHSGVHLDLETDGGAHVCLYNGSKSLLAQSNYVQCTLSGSSCEHAPHLFLAPNGTLALTTDLRSESITLQTSSFILL